MFDAAEAADNHPDKPSPLQLVQAEVAQETAPTLPDLPAGAALVPIADIKVAVLSEEDWPSSANEAMMHGQWNQWARRALARDEDVIAWLTLDPTNRQVAEFLNAWAAETGGAVGNAFASPRGLPRTRGR